MSTTTAHNTGRELSTATRWAAMAVLSASLLVITMDMTILNIAIPEMAAELQPTSDQQLWIIDIYSLVLAGLLITSAGIADRWGRKKMLLTGYVIFLVASLLVLIAETAVHVIAIRALLGVGGAMIMPTTLSLIRVIFTNPRERATALSIWAAVSGLGAAVGPLIGGALLENFSWHSAFLINVPLMAIGIIAGVIFLPESTVPQVARLDFVAAILSLLGMVALVWSIKQFGKEAALDLPVAWVALAIALIALTWFVQRNRRREHPLLEISLFRSRPFSAGIIAALGSTFSMIAAILLIAQWLQLVQGFSPIETGIRLIPVAIAGALASLAAPPLSRILGSRLVLAGGLSLAALGMILIGIQGEGLSMTLVTPALMLIGAGTGSLAIGSAMIMGNSPEDKAGNAGALEESAYELGAALGVAVLGSISALVYRREILDAASVSQLQNLDPDLASATGESLGGAVAIADHVGVPEIASDAATAFTLSLETAGIIGGAIMLAVAIGVFALTPKGTEITSGSH